ncbi:hypothetical protein J437_LFUL007492 [Ladona fulva]|uniref:TNFR-Cys domain-containing protein n=1 Tax=Ladona fulva TaxID=123851 RepID=A0A8K0P555_LADFU|nr:hypothetical protein J437_LFUL007492 [Ladona fulva]
MFEQNCHCAALLLCKVKLVHRKRVEERRAHRHGRHNRRKCTACPPGWGVMYPCNATADTICEECGSGTYSPHHSAVDGCWVCSQCGWGLFKSHPCTPEADTTCDSCLTARPRPLGEDFDRKCLFGRRPPDLPPPPPLPGGGQAVAHRRAINDTSADNEDRGAGKNDMLTDKEGSYYGI